MRTRRPVRYFWPVRCNGFALHLDWHLALFHLEHGADAAALDLYDRTLRPVAGEPVRDLSSAVSLLWRIEQHGTSVGRRWHELADLAGREAADAPLVLTGLHGLLALLASGDPAGAAKVAETMAARARNDHGDQAGVARAVGVPLAEALLNGAGDAARPCIALDAITANLPAIGGSHAQRDVFVRALAVVAARRRDEPTLQRILAIRRTAKRDDRFVASLGNRTCSVRIGDPRDGLGRLMAAAQSGDRAAYTRLLGDIVPVARAFARRRGLADADCDDLVQDVLTTVHRVRDTYDPAPPFGPRFTAIMKRRAIDRLRREGRRRLHETACAREFIPDTEPRDEVLAGEAATWLCRLVATLPRRQREALELAKLCELPVAEAATRAGQSCGALRVNVHRAMRSLRARHAAEGAASLA